MKKKLIITWLMFFCLSTFSIIIPNKIFASGDLTTSQDNQPGQIQTTKDGDILYLSTETNNGGSTDLAGNYFSLISSPIQLPTGFAKDLGSLINAVLSLVMVICALLVLFYLIWGSFEWITSGGDKGKTDSARQKIVAAIVGIIIVASSYAVLTLALNFLGFASLNELLGGLDTISGQTTNQESTAATETTNSATPSTNTNNND